MEKEGLGAAAGKICREMELVFAKAEEQGIDPASVMVEEIVNTAKGGGRVVVHGVGREGLMMKGLCMRLFHLGINTSCVGDMTAPAVSRGDLVIGSAGPGGFSTVEAIFRQAKGAGARILLLTARPEGSASQFAHIVVAVPAQTMAVDHNTAAPSASILPMGSLYEGALFILFEIVILRLSSALGRTAEAMRSMHTNLE
jgi:6-phospho 3-hexuloisomerase